MTQSVVVTGASSGLGEATSTQLAAKGWHVVLGCRSPERGQVAAARIRRRVPHARIEVLELDLAALDSVRSAAAALTESGDRPPLRALVANAAVEVVNGIQRTADGYELTFGTNHLGHFLLITLLLEHLAEPARIVLVSSRTHGGPLRAGGYPGPKWAHPRTLADPDARHLHDSPRSGRIRYATSKLASVYTTYELARRVRDRAITVNAFDPGMMPGTALLRDYPPRTQRLFVRLSPLLLRAVPFAQTVEQAAQHLAQLVTSPEVADVTGAYFAGNKQRRTSKASYDEDAASELWTVSEELVGRRAPTPVAPPEESPPSWTEPES
jgi:light-dependent protochlorophyllide reductase